MTMGSIVYMLGMAYGFMDQLWQVMIAQGVIDNIALTSLTDQMPTA